MAVELHRLHAWRELGRAALREEVSRMLELVQTRGTSLMRHLLAAALAATLLLGVVGCQPPVMRARMEVPRQTTQQVARDLSTTPEVEPLVGELSHEASHGAVRALSAELPASVGPAVRAMIVDDLLQHPDFRQAVAETSHEIGKQVALGTTEAIAQTAEEKPSTGLAPLAAVVPRWAWFVAVVVLLVALGISLAFLVRQRNAARRSREEAPAGGTLRPA